MSLGCNPRLRVQDPDLNTCLTPGWVHCGMYILDDLTMRDIDCMTLKYAAKYRGPVLGRDRGKAVARRTLGGMGRPEMAYQIRHVTTEHAENGDGHKLISHQQHLC